MVDDIKYVCMLWRVGCTKGKVSNWPLLHSGHVDEHQAVPLSANAYVQALSARCMAQAALWCHVCHHLLAVFQAFSRKQHDKRGADGANNVEAALPLAAATARQSLKGAGPEEQGMQEGEQVDRKHAVVNDLTM